MLICLKNRNENPESTAKLEHSLYHTVNQLAVPLHFNTRLWCEFSINTWGTYLHSLDNEPKGNLPVGAFALWIFSYYFNCLCTVPVIQK